MTFTNQNQSRAWDTTRNANNGVIGSGTLRVTGDINVIGQGGVNPGNSIAANLDFGGGTQVVRVGVLSSFAGSNALMFTGNLSNGSLVKTIGFTSSGNFGSVDGISLFGDNTYTGATIFNAGTNIATGTNASQSLTISGIAAAFNTSSITLQGAKGSFLSATSINAVGGGRFFIDNNVALGASGNNTPNIAAAQNNDRIRNDATITLRDGTFVYRGLASTTASETYGNLAVTGGHNVVVVAPNAGTSTISATNLTLSPRSTLAIGTAGPAGTAVLGTQAKVLFSGTIPSADSTGILRGIVTGTSTVATSVAPTVTDLVTYDATDGFKAYSAYATDFSTAGTNVNVSAATTLTSSQSINALKATTGSAFTTTINAGTSLTVNSGMMISTSAAHTVAGGTLAFGNNPGMIFGSHTINSAITGTQGLVQATGTLTLASDMSGLSGTLSNIGNGITTNLNTGTFSGPIEVRGGTLSIGVNQIGTNLGAITLGVAQNDAKLFSLVPTISFSSATVTQIDRDIVVRNGGTDLYGFAPQDDLVARLQPVGSSATGPTQTLSGDILLDSDVALFGQGVTATSTSATRFTGDITGTGRFLIRNGRAIFDVGSTWANSGGFTIGATGNVAQVSFFGTGLGSGDINVTGSTTGVMGLIRYNNNNSFGTGAINVLTGASTGLTFEPIVSTRITNQINLNNGTSPTFINVGSGITAEWAGRLTGNGIITKNGTGTWIISGAANSHTGSMIVSSGSLLVNSSVAASANGITVASGATLGGSGVINRNIIANGRIAPGNSPGSLTINGNITFASTGVLDIELNSNVPGSGYDQLIVNGTVDLGSASLSLVPGFTLGENDRLFILVNDGTDAIIGNFSGLAEGAIFSWTFNGNSQNAAITYLANSTTNSLSGGNDIALSFTAIPEPSSICLLGLATLGLFRSRKTRAWLRRQRALYSNRRSPKAVG